MSLRYENTAEVGDLIKAFDFEPMEGRPDRFIYGIVTAKNVEFAGGARGYEIKGAVRVRAAENENDDPEVMEVGSARVPFETSMDYEGRIVNLQTGGSK